jgi:hypothetical protein
VVVLSRGFLNARHEQAYVLVKGRPAKPARPLDDVRPWEYSGNFAWNKQFGAPKNIADLGALRPPMTATARLWPEPGFRVRTAFRAISNSSSPSLRIGDT